MKDDIDPTLESIIEEEAELNTRPNIPQKENVGSVDSPARKGEQGIGGSTPDPESDDDVSNMMEDATGENMDEPKNRGKTLGDIVNAAEAFRHGKNTEEEE